MKKNLKKVLALLTTLLFVAFFISCTSSKPEQKWVGTWVTAQQLVEPYNVPPQPGISNNTLRQIVRVSIGGDSLRVRFSNEYSTSPIVIKEAQIALSAGQGNIDTTSIKPLFFNNSKETTIEAGSAILSDAIAFNLNARTDVSISIYFGQTPSDITGHPGSRTTSYIFEGNAVNSSGVENAIPTDHWYVISGIDVKVPEQSAAVAILGNSITDGRGSGTNKQNRWPDIFSESLLENPNTQHVAVLNQGIGGNCVLKQCLGPSAIDRFESDVLNQHGVKWMIILEGVNDLGQTQDSAQAMQVANDLIVAFQSMIEQAHSNNIKAYGATILPFGKSFYYADYRETARQKVNHWMRNSGQFDAIIDFDHIMRNPNDTISLKDNVHSGDFLHPNEEGYQLMGTSVDLSLFEQNCKTSE